MNIQGGGLSFEITGTNKQLLSVLNESKKAIQQFSTTATQGGANIDKTFRAAAAEIDRAFAQIDTVINENKTALNQLQQKYAQLGKQAGVAFKAGRDQEYASLSRQQEQLKAEISLRKTVIAEAAKTADALLQEEQALKKQQEAATKNSNAQASLRTQLRNVREELAQMEQAGQRGTEKFKELQHEAGRLADAIGDAQAQAKIFSHDNQGLQGMIAGLSGVVGAFSAAQGAVALFAGENENLQKLMLKVQALMSITMGLQQVANALNKDSAFMLVTVRKAKELLAAAELKLATALGISTAAARAFMLAITLGLAGAITAIIAVIDHFSSASRKAEEFNKKVAETATEPVSKVELLSAKWKALGNDLDTKKKFIEENKKAFDELGVSIRNVADAENLLVNNKEAFIQAQIDKAKATAYIELQKENIEKLIKTEQALDEIVAKGADAGFIKRIKKELDILRSTIEEGYKLASEEETKALKIMKDAAIEAADDGQEAADAFTQYVLSGTANAESNMARFVDRIKKMYNGAVDELTNSTNSFAQGLGSMLGRFGNFLGNSPIGNFFNFGGGELGRADGTIADRLSRIEKRYEDSVKHLADLRAKDSKATAEDIENAQKEVDKYADLYKKLSGVGITSDGAGGNEKTKTEQFAEELNKRKALYEKYLKWVTSSDETVRNAAASEFAPLLAEGNSYLDYLERKRADIEAKATKTAADLRNLASLNNEIADITRESVISTFNTQLQQELALCKTIGEMLATIERRRSELSGDNSDVDNAKAEILNTAESDTRQQAKDETKALLREYAGYLQEKIEFEESYARKKELLTKQAAEAATEAERQAAEKGLENLEAKQKEYAKRSGDEQYDVLLQEYQTYQQQQTAILEKYAAQRASAEKQGNTDMIAQINAKQQSELSSLAAQRLMASESWTLLFSDISRLSTTTINRLLNDINSRKINLSAEFNPADLKAINDQLNMAKNELQARNPFLALRQSLSELRAAMKAEKMLDSDDPFVKSLEEKKKQYAEYTDAINSSDTTLAGAAKEVYAELLTEGSDYIDMLRRKIATLDGLKLKGELTIEGQEQLDILNAALNKEQGITKSVGEGFKDAFADLGSSLTFLSSSFGSVVSGIKKMGISMDEETEAILGDIGSMLDGAAQLAQGFSGNPLALIQGSIGFFSSAFSLFNTRDRKAEKSIKKHEGAVTRLGRAYTALEHAVDNALGEAVYTNQNALIQNLRQQQKEIQGMVDDEISKKDTDWERVEEFQERYDEAGRQIKDIIAEITKSITQTDAKEASTELMNAIIEACEQGSDSLNSFKKVYEDVANNIAKQAVANALRIQLLEKPLQNAIKQLQKDMGFDEEGNGAFDGLTQSEQDRFKDAVAAAGANFKAAMDLYKDLFAELDESDPTSLSGAIKGTSQESIDLLAGQTNAVRQNQVVAIEIFRQQLLYLSNMDNKLGNISTSLISILNRMGIDDSTDLRSQGITD